MLEVLPPSSMAEVYEFLAVDGKSSSTLSSLLSSFPPLLVDLDISKLVLNFPKL